MQSAHADPPCTSFEEARSSFDSSPPLVTLQIQVTTKKKARFILPGLTLLARGDFHRSDICIDFIINTDITRVIPAYAAPGGATGSHNLLLSNRHVQDLRWQYLRNAEGTPN